MLRGDISNRAVPVLGFRVDGFLLKYKNDSIVDKALSFIKGIENHAELNIKVLATLNYIFKHTPYGADLFVQKEYYSKSLIRFLDNVRYSNLRVFTKPVEIAIQLNIRDIMYFVDDSEENRSLIGHKHCITLEKADFLIGRG